MKNIAAIRAMIAEGLSNEEIDAETELWSCEARDAIESAACDAGWATEDAQYMRSAGQADPAYNDAGEMLCC